MLSDVILPSEFSRRDVLSSLAGVSLLGGLSSCAFTGMVRNQTNDIVSLTAGPMQVDLAPLIGGSIARFRHGDRNIMRPGAINATDATEQASFPLVPIVNRIPMGKFTFQGKDVSLSGNFMGQPEFIHGYGWTAPWSVVERKESQAELHYDYPGGEWPWAFQAIQKFQLSGRGLRHTLSVQNLSDSAMPADLGFHPYFSTTPDTRLQFDYEGHWVNDARGVAQKRVPGPFRRDFSEGASLYDTEMTDQTHYDWAGIAVLSNPEQPDIIIKAGSKCRNLHVFFPPNGDYVAIEPTLGRGNPFGVKPVEYSVLQPGENQSIWMEILIDLDKGMRSSAKHVNKQNILM